MTEAISRKREPVDLRPAFLSSDARLVRQAAGGSRSAATAIYNRYSQGLYRYCQAILGNTHDAQDALQNCFAKAFRALEGESREIQLKPWLYRIAYNESIDLIRARRSVDEIDPEEAAPQPTPQQTLEERQRLEQLVGDIGALPERQRGALVMRELSGMGFEEIGRALETSPAVVRQTIYEARVGLREMEAGREMSCERVMKSLSDDDGRILRRRDVRAHLRACGDCREFEKGIATRKHQLNGLAPLSPVAAAGILQGLLGAQGGAGGGGLLALLGGGSGAAFGSSAAIKSVAAVVAVSAAGGYAANVAGVVHLPVPDSSGGGRSAVSAPPSNEEAGPGAGRPGSATASPLTEGSSAGAGGDAGGSASPQHEAEPGPAEATPISGGAKAEQAPVAASTAEDVAPEHPGNGSPGDLPAASAHGQQTAASHAPDLPPTAQANSAHPAPPAHAGGPKGPPSAPPPAPAGSPQGGPPASGPPKGPPPHAQGGPSSPPGGGGPPGN